MENCHKAQQKWAKTTFSERAKVLFSAADLLEQNAEKYAKIMTTEMGKPITSAIAEVKKCAWVCRYYAENAEQQLQDEMIVTDAAKSYVSFQPLGVVLAVMPWNYPLWQVFRFAAPAIMAGNGGLLKHSSNVPLSSQAVEDIFIAAGLPKDVFQNLWISSSSVADIIKNPIVKATTLTGSEPAGIAVAQTSAAELKKSVLELGGSDPYIICSDADIAEAAKQCAESRLMNNGQSCIGAKRFIVMEDVYDAFLSALTANMQAVIMGDPMDAKTTLGPLAKVTLRDELHQQVERSITAGAKLHIGGYIPEHQGAFYPPTILTEVKKGMPAYEEELFGPVASVIKVHNIDEAIKVANDTSFGLGACIFSQDINNAERIAREELQVGCCFVNQYVKSDPRLPFGGIKRSGFGRELSHYGIKEFVNIKTVYVK